LIVKYARIIGLIQLLAIIHYSDTLDDEESGSFIVWPLYVGIIIASPVLIVFGGNCIYQASTLCYIANLNRKERSQSICKEFVAN